MSHKVFVYKNLRKKFLIDEDIVCGFSIRNVYTGRVEDHQAYVVIENAIFKISEAGRQRVLKEKRKNVHAGVQGTISWKLSSTHSSNAEVKYNPYKGGYFVNVYGDKLSGAEIVYLTPRGVFAYGQQHLKEDRKTP